MAKPLKNHPRSFENWGKQGGLKRARRLSPLKRSTIASRAASARWNNPPTKTRERHIMSIRLDNPQWNDPVFLEELLSEGALTDWKRIYQIIAEHPFGPTAQALEKIINSTKIYGVIPLWKGILRNVQNTL